MIGIYFLIAFLLGIPAGWWLFREWKRRKAIRIEMEAIKARLDRNHLANSFLELTELYLKLKEMELKGK